MVVAVVALVSLAGCSGLGGGPAGDGTADDAGADGSVVESGNATPGATGVDHTLRVTVNESAGSEWESVAATYPRDRFSVDSVQHGDLRLGVDTDGDGALDREFDGSHVSGANNNDYSFTVGLDTDYTLEAGDVVVVEYPAVDNPGEPGEYAVEVTVNDAQTTTGNVTVGE